MMKTVDGFHYAYNAQAVVDEHSQVVVAADVTQQAGDVHQLIPMIDAVSSSLTNVGIEDDPKVTLADAGVLLRGQSPTAHRSEGQRCHSDREDPAQRTGTGRTQRTDPERRDPA